ncbi:unnamed protein product [Coregonus sp. 'balchen']|nr:unnamed protein product [Coregonus sp. 'balchen']
MGQEKPLLKSQLLT